MSSSTSSSSSSSSFSLVLLFSFLFLFLLPLVSSSAPNKLDPYLSSRVSQLSSADSLNLFIIPQPVDDVTLPAKVQARLQTLRDLLSLPLSQIPRSQRRGMVHEVRSTLAQASQIGILQELSKWSSEVTRIDPLWIVNAVYVRGASKALIDTLVARDDIIMLRGDRPVAMVGPARVVAANEPRNADEEMLEWGLTHIGADRAWNITKGEGVVVAIIDTGVRETHEALVDSYRGHLGNGQFDHDYNWFDPKEFQNDEWWCIPGICSPPECCIDTPFDPIGHGSHVTGTAVGSEKFGIGVAPGAKWVGAKGCRDGQCLNYGLIASAEWVLCPTRLDGSEPDCSKGADIVSNSWGGNGEDDWYMEFTTAWRDAGIIPVFSQGNSGPRCETLGSPGDYDHVIGVAATDPEVSLASFSSRGPGSGNPGFATNKPDVSAPGVDIRSASSMVGSSNNQLYSVYSGTSMAAPHVTGTIALLLSVNPDLSYSQIVDILGKTANKAVGEPDNGWLGGDDTCGGRHYSQLPSFHYGQGVIDAYEAVLAARASKM